MHWRTRMQPPTPKPRRESLRSTVLWSLIVLVAWWIACSGPGVKPAGASPAPADSLATLPPDTLAAMVLDLTWLVEDLQAERLRDLALADLRADSLRTRAAYWEGVAANRPDRHWLVESWEAIDQWVWSFVTLVLTLWAVDISG